MAPRPARTPRPDRSPAAHETRPPPNKGPTKGPPEGLNQGPNEGWAEAAAALAHCAADPSAPLAEFGCGTGGGGAALARAGFSRIDGFDLCEANLAAAARRGVYRRLRRGDIAAAAPDAPLEPGVYANVATMNPLDPARMAPEVIDRMLALVPPGGFVLFSLPGAGVSLGPFCTRLLELCEYFIAEPVLRRHAVSRAGLQTTLYVLKKR